MSRSTSAASHRYSEPRGVRGAAAVLSQVLQGALEPRIPHLGFSLAIQTPCFVRAIFVIQATESRSRSRDHRLEAGAHVTHQSMSARTFRNGGTHTAAKAPTRLGRLVGITDYGPNPSGEVDFNVTITLDV